MAAHAARAALSPTKLRAALPQHRRMRAGRRARVNAAHGVSRKGAYRHNMLFSGLRGWAAQRGAGDGTRGASSGIIFGAAAMVGRTLLARSANIIERA
jgi:hypothetical protein